jgi:hypothetical protein
MRHFLLALLVLVSVAAIAGCGRPITVRVAPAAELAADDFDWLAVSVVDEIVDRWLVREGDRVMADRVILRMNGEEIPTVSISSRIKARLCARTGCTVVAEDTGLALRMVFSEAARERGTGTETVVYEFAVEVVRGNQAVTLEPRQLRVVRPLRPATKP